MKLFAFLKGEKTRLFLLLGLLVITLVFAVYYFFYRDVKTVVQMGEKAYRFPVYTLLQNEEAKVIAYDYVNKKHIQLYTMTYKNTGADYGYEFFADLSPDGKKVVYSTDAGIFVYNLETKEIKELLKSKRPAPNNEVGFIETYTNPKWTYNGERIFYSTNGYEMRGLNIMNADGTEPKQIKNSSGDYLLSKSSDDYFVGNFNDMAGDYGLLKNISDPLSEVRSILPSGSLYGVNHMDFGETENNLYFSGIANPNETQAQKYEIASMNIKNGSVKTVFTEKDENTYISSLKYSSLVNSVYYSRMSVKPDENGNTKGLGIFKLIPSSGESSEFYKDGNNKVVVNGIADNYMVLESSPPTYAREAIKKLVMISLSDKDISIIGEANKINFSGWIESNFVKDYKDTIDTPTATEKELEDYAYSQKTKETLFKTFYNYCWDYDCKSATFPYPKLSTSLKPEIVNLQEKPLSLTGNVSVPVVFLQFDDKSILDYQINAFKDINLYNSIASFGGWINNQASKYNQGLDFKFSFKEPVTLKKNDSCLEYEGVNKFYSSECVKDAINKKYPELQNEKLVILSLGRIYRGDNSDSYGLRSNYKLSDKNNSYLLSTWSIQKRLGLDAELIDIPENEFRDYMNSKDNGYAWWFYNMDVIPRILNEFGAQNKKAIYKKPSNPDSASCYVGEKNDIMCSQYLEGGSNKYYYNFNDLIIGDITRKELGWYDMDGDKIREVDK